MPRLRIGFDTGFPAADAQNDFVRVRRERVVARVAGLMRGEADVSQILPLEEVVQALGRLGERRLGVRSIPLENVVGTAGRPREFDRSFRPRTRRVRRRWEGIAEAMRRGTSLPPISVHQVGELYFVDDGHHRVSVARALGLTHIAADVTYVRTAVPPGQRLRLTDLPLKTHERVFLERVPLPEEARGEVRLPDPWMYAALAEGVEAWGFRWMQARGDGLAGRDEVARAWLDEEYRPAVAMLLDAGLVDPGAETEGYMRVAGERYRLLRTHRWSEDVVAAVREARS